MAAARKTPRRTSTAKTGSKHKEARPKPAGTPLLLSESGASQTLQSEELRRTELELEAARKRYAELHDFSPAGHLTLDVNGTIVEANLKVCTLLGENRKELIGQPLLRFIVGEDEDTFHRHFQDVLKRGRRQTCEVHLRGEAGVSHWVHLESLAVHDESGRIIRCMTALLEVSDRKQAELELEIQRARLDGIIGSAMDAIITVDEGERVLLFNHAAETMFLCPAVEAIGQPLERFIPERFREAHHDHLSVFLRSPVPSRSAVQRGTLIGLRGNGEEFPFEASISHVLVQGKQLLTVILRDITERKVAEDALQASNAFTGAVLNSLTSHICVLDKDGVILKTNDAWKEFSRNNSDRTVAGVDVGQNYLDICRRAIVGGESATQVVLDGIESVLAGNQPIFSTEYPCHSPEEERWFQMRVKPLKGARGVVISHTDISEQVRLARSLERHVLLLDEKREELEFLSGKLIQSQEQERQRIACDLHDDFNQRLAGLAVDLEMLERGPAEIPESVSERLSEIREQLGRLSDDLHGLAYTLHPSLLEHIGLEAAIQEHVAQFAKRTGLPVTFTAREVPESLSPDLATCLFRVMQESLQNVSKHAQTTDLTVKLSGSPKGIGLSVRDTGKGFDMDGKARERDGLGLVSMQERVRLLGGLLRIHSKLGGGTKVCAWIPRSQGRT